MITVKKEKVQTEKEMLQDQISLLQAQLKAEQEREVIEATAKRLETNNKLLTDPQFIERLQKYFGAKNPTKKVVEFPATVKIITNGFPSRRDGLTVTEVNVSVSTPDKTLNKIFDKMFTNGGYFSGYWSIQSEKDILKIDVKEFEMVCKQLSDIIDDSSTEAYKASIKSLNKRFNIQVD